MKPEQLAVMGQAAEQRFSFLIKEVVNSGKVWILTDEHGSVMLNTEDEDCVPVWPAQEFAEYWATGEWSHCEAKSIDLSAWHDRWTSGLMDDDVCVVVFPIPDEPGLVVFADEFDDALQERSRRRS